MSEHLLSQTRRILAFLGLTLYPKTPNLGSAGKDLICQVAEKAGDEDFFFAAHRKHINPEAQVAPQIRHGRHGIRRHILSAALPPTTTLFAYTCVYVNVSTISFGAF
jgi:hypothetical protein